MSFIDFQDLRLDHSLNLLIGPNETVQLEPIVADLIYVLAQAQGELVTKDELIEKVWKRQFVSDDAINKIVSKARQSMSDNPARPKYIQTIRGRGYRLLVNADTSTLTRISGPRNASGLSANKLLIAAVAVLVLGLALFVSLDIATDPKIVHLGDEASQVRVIK